MRLAVTHSWISRLFRETGSQSPGPSSRFWAALAAIRACTTYSRMATSTLEPGPASTSEGASSSKCSRDWRITNCSGTTPPYLDWRGARAFGWDQFFWDAGQVRRHPTHLDSVVSKI